MQAAQFRALHFRANGSGAIFGQTVYAGAHQKMRAQLLPQAEQLIYVAFPIPDMNTARRITEQLGGLAQVLQPTNALFFFNGHPRGINPALQRVRAVKLVSVPELDGGQSEGQALTCVHQARSLTV